MSAIVRLPLFALIFAVMLLAGCQPGMSYQPKYKPLAPGKLFGNGASAQVPVAGTVARAHLDEDDPFYRGRVSAPSGAFVARSPVRATRELLARGRERFEIYCAVCHGRDGYGDGIVPARGFSHPPSFHQARLREVPDGYIFDVISNGLGAMFSYGDRVEPADRWAIVAYVRALQLSQNAKASDLKPGEVPHD